MSALFGPAQTHCRASATNENGILHEPSTRTKYTYDTDTTCGTSNGDLVKRIDAIGNVTCFSYDASHRQLSVTHPSGSYSSTTPNKYFVYDAATVNGVVMTNVKGRLAEAYTCMSPCSTKLTDDGFSYTARGQASDLYQITPHSSYYHSSATFFANGALQQLTGYLGTNNDYWAPYTLDGEGRVYSAASWLTSTSYNSASEPTTLNFGSGDSDTLTYDPNTSRMTKYTFTVNNQSVVGNLTWNANGTLGSLAITDPFNGANAQSCNYTHDDLVRISSANCGSTWSQTFSYDAFGNLTQSGSMSFQPVYSSTTNHMTQLGSITPTYDSNGNLTNDSINTYSWDADGHVTAVNGQAVSYDALGRMVEAYANGGYLQRMYSPTGFLMEVPSTQKKFVPLPGGAAVIYYPSAPGGYYYRHADWLGTSRFASTPSRTMYYDLAYAPFGAPYANNGPGAGEYVFTGMEHTFPNLYDFPAREYGIQGRWPSPDPSGISAFHLTDPQSLNRYAYARNTPLSLIDPTGLDELAGDCQMDTAQNRDPLSPDIASRGEGAFFETPPDDGCPSGGNAGGGTPPPDPGPTTDPGGIDPGSDPGTGTGPSTGDPSNSGNNCAPADPACGDPAPVDPTFGDPTAPQIGPDPTTPADPSQEQLNLTPLPPPTPQFMPNINPAIWYGENCAGTMNCNMMSPYTLQARQAYVWGLGATFGSGPTPPLSCGQKFGLTAATLGVIALGGEGSPVSWVAGGGAVAVDYIGVLVCD